MHLVILAAELSSEYRPAGCVPTYTFNLDANSSHYRIVQICVCHIWPVY